jgi:hypothetical protein
MVVVCGLALGVDWDKAVGPLWLPHVTTLAKLSIEGCQGSMAEVHSTPFEQHDRFIALYCY